MRDRSTGMRHASRALLLLGALLVGGCGGGSSPTASGPSATEPHGPSAVVALDASNFDELVTMGDGVGLVEFFHPACSHCRNMEPVVEQLAVDFQGRAMVGKVDVTVSPQITQAWGVRGYPTFVVVKDGLEFSRRLGEQAYADLATILNTALQNAA